MLPTSFHIIVSMAATQTISSSVPLSSVSVDDTLGSSLGRLALHHQDRDQDDGHTQHLQHDRVTQRYIIRRNAFILDDCRNESVEY